MTSLSKFMLNCLSLALLIAIIVFAFLPKKPVPATEVSTIRLGRTVLTVEIAKTDAEIERGLSNRSSIDNTDGMLFVFTEESILKFWMRETYLNLFIIYFDRQGRFINCHEMSVEPRGTSLKDFKLYESTFPAQYALELPTTSKVGRNYCEGRVKFNLERKH